MVIFAKERDRLAYEKRVSDNQILSLR
jgi:hypothetical protein